MRAVHVHCFWVAAMLIVGCGGGPSIDVEMVDVSGTVKYDDGTIPKGEPCIIRFEPVGGADVGQVTKAASASISPDDGSFEMSTVKPGDGVIVGKYKVVYTIRESAESEADLVADPFTKASTTPHEIEVTDDISELQYVIHRPKAPRSK